MNKLEAKIIDTLIDLKEHHQVVGIKTEFETESTSIEETLRLKEIASIAGLDLTIKISGCASIKDLYEAKEIGANSIVAPMVESTYAAKKFFETIKMVYNEEERSLTNFFINIETIQGFNNLRDILESDFTVFLKGIVFGRSDMTGSLGISKEEINNYKVLELAKEISNLTFKYNKEFIVGGGVSPSSIPFFKQIPYLSNYETRKIIFDKKALSNKSSNEGILKAIEFEIMWIKNKQNPVISDKQRLKELENRYKNIISVTL